MLQSIPRIALLGALAASPAAAARPSVAVTVAPLAEIVERLAGANVEVVTLVPPGADVESYAVEPSQAAALERAALLVAVGHPAVALEARLVAPWVDRHGEGARVALADHLRGGRGSGNGEPDAAARADPHLWLSPRVVRGAAAELAVELERLLPAEAAAIRSRAVALTAEIAAVEERLGRRLGAHGGRFLIDHPSLGHLARELGLEQVALENEGKEPTPAQLARLVERARRDGYRVVLVQRGASRRGAELLAREIGAELVEIDALARDWLANLERLGEALARAVVR
jgi:zinc transport system substrate-binding protein